MGIILIVEDDSTLNELLCVHLEEQGHDPKGAASLAEARSVLRDAPVEAVLLDYQLPDGNGLQLLQEIREEYSSLPVIMITGADNTTLPIEAIKQGAYDFIRKPMDHAELDATLNNALEVRRLSRKVTVVTTGDDYQVSLDNIVGRSHAIIDVCKTIGRVAPTDATVLITGGSGTGKEVVARAIHHHSGRRGLFLPVNCSAIVDTLLESELFGHEKGSFTGADRRKEGKFEAANDGTLFLDEVGEMSLPLQAKLLRVLQERSFERVGGIQTLHTTARIVAATNRDLAAEVKDRKFREDLYYRLNVITVYLPPLRERMDDLPLLVEHLLRKINNNLHKRVIRVAQAAWQLMKAYSWPGNVRELENVLTRAVVLARSETLTPDSLGISPGPVMEELQAVPGTSKTGPELISLEDLSQRHVQAILEHVRWHKGKACEILGISRPALERRIRKLGQDDLGAE